MDSNQATTSSGATSSGSGGSPWDDDVEVPKKDDGPKIIGTLEPKVDSLPEKEEQPVPFNIPKDIGEQVGKKVPASNVAANDQSIPNPAFTSVSTGTIAKPIVAPVGKPISNDVLPQNIGEQVGGEKVPVSSIATKPVVDPAGKPISNDISPQPKETPEPEISPPASLQTPANNPQTVTPKPKKGLFGIFKKNDSAPAKPTKPTLPTAQSQNASVAQANPVQKPNIAKQAAPKFAKSGKPPFFKKPAFIITTCAILLLAIITFLTESGVISVGLENVYGVVGLESAFGGLPKNPEKALAMAVAKNKDHPNFKISGTMSLTVNKTINSTITSPLVSMIGLPIALRDNEAGSAVSAILAQYEDYYSSGDTSTDTTSTSTDSSSSSSTSTSTTAPSTTTAPTTDSTTSGSASSSFLGDQSQYPGYVQEETTIKQLDFAFSGISNQDASSLDVTVKKLVGADSKISLINSKNDLYVKTGSDIKFDPKADPNKWLNYKIKSISDSGSGITQLFSSKPDQNFSIIGSRVANEKVGGVRCYNYQIEKLEIGGMFDSMGIKSEMIQKINGNVWIGVSDHLIHKIDLIVIPSISSAVTRVEINLEFTNYDVENDITTPSLTDKIDVLSQASGADPAIDTTVPAVSNVSPTISSAEQNDSLRKTDLAKIKGGLAVYKQKYGRYPVSSALLRLNVSGNVVEKAIVPTYIDAMPADPKAAEGWYYGYTSNGNSFKLSARFENLNDPQITKSGDVYLHFVYND